MATIINIETSTDVCSASLSMDGAILENRENYDGHTHSTLLNVFIDELLHYARTRELKIDAVAVSIGPGSYTGLRIGLSEAKGLAFGLDVPLIGVNTLQLMAVSVMFQEFFDDDVLYAPMIDARRMEVYTALYDQSLEPRLVPQSMILDDKSFLEWLENNKIVFLGNGCEKAQTLIHHSNAMFRPDVKPVACNMLALAEKAFREGDFLDLAYSTPLYLKDFQATKSKKSILV
ncbi:MAG: tRNA (adenosine(37)-N6)-threonylcarbamoyltransferase complex dimerization subunit type 1 TsaB [Muribaculaceae bacterium]|nr:tRNA (adenosine(37)-N6)-threonylcarbamoyltransferase complex dimerization subunit type 1 TsaB [Muribaculaceae bacterium]